MQPELQHKLFKDFPLLYLSFPQFVRNGFDIGDGWFQLLYDLSEKLEPLTRKMKETGSSCFCGAIKEDHPNHNRKEPCIEFNAAYMFVQQVKEKFDLRYYVNIHTEEMGALIEEACQKSISICTECGKSGHEISI